jgi:hypothetical protein
MFGVGAPGSGYEPTYANPENAGSPVYLAAPGPTFDKRLIEREVAAGLPHEQLRLAEAIENQAFYDLDASRYLPRREAENEFDFVGRPKQESGFTQEVVDVLCEHQYNPGPSRQAAEAAAADAFLQEVYEHNHVNSLMREAEVLSTLNDVAAIQVVATNDPDHPVRLHLWGSDELAVFVDPDDPSRPVAVATIDRVDQTTRYRLWFADEVVTYLTAKLQFPSTSGGRIAIEQRREPNTYAAIPFAFVHYRPPLRRFWTPGLGTFLRKAEVRINTRLSKLDETLDKYATPIGLFKNVPVDFNPNVEPGRFLRLPPVGSGFTGGSWQNPPEPKAEYLQAQLAVVETWEHIQRLIDQVLEAARVPRAAVRMERTGVASGISLIVEQAPLLGRARRRHADFAVYETNLARTILHCAGSHYGRPELAAAAAGLRLLLAWPEPSIPIPGPDRDLADQAELSLGIKSRIQLVMERRGLSREQAVAYLEQVALDEAEFARLTPEMTAEPDENEPAEGDEDEPDDAQGRSAGRGQEEDA